MSAPNNAEPLGTQGWQNKDGTPCNIKDLPKVRCESCRWKGTVCELLGVDPEENQTMWCPRCRTASWIYC